MVDASLLKTYFTRIKVKDKHVSSSQTALIPEYELSNQHTRQGSSPSPSPGSDDGRGSHNDENGKQRAMWTPTILHSATIIAFGAVFAAILISVEVLFTFSNRNRGLSTSDPKYYYLWTYGPTAVLTIIAGFWGQVEYRTKQLMPWKSMWKTPQPASHSLLLDYISDWNVVSMFRSLKYAHWVVGLTILGSLLLKLLIVLSTGLFMLDNIRMDNITIELMTQAAFSGDGYDSQSVDGNAVLTVAGARWLNLSYPVGTTVDYAFQPFNASSTNTGGNAVLSGEVDMFSADLECDTGTLKKADQYCRSSGCEQLGLNLTISTPSCDGYKFHAFYRSYSFPGGWFGNVFEATCSGSSNEGEDGRLIFVAGQWVDNSTRLQSLVCSPTYAIAKGAVSLLNGNQSVVDIHQSVDDTSNHTLPGVTGLDIGLGLITSLDAAEATMKSLVEANIQDSATKVNYSDPNTNYISAFYKIANMSSPYPMDDLLDASFLTNISREIYKSMGAQVAKRYLMDGSAQKFTGAYSAGQNRLMVRELSVRFMEATLAILIVLSIAIWIWRPVRCVSRDPGTISGLATIMARSPHISDPLVGVTNKRTMRSILTGGLYSGQVNNGGTFNIESKETSVEESRPAAGTGNAMQWWKPLGVTLWYRIVSVVLPILVIIGLEVAYQLSRRDIGLASIDSDGYIRYTWVYIPALIMLTVRIFFDTIHFAAMVFQPYVELRRDGATAPGSMMENHLSKVTVASFWCALTRKQFGLSATALTVLLAPVLTVAISGLYSTENIRTPHAISIIRSDSFNSSINPQSSTPEDPGIGLTGALVVSSNLTYPAWTYNEVILPTLQEDSLTETKKNTPYQPSNKTSDDSSMLHITLPALRAGLNCDAFAPDSFVSLESPSDMFAAWTVDIRHGNCTYGNNNYFDFSIETDYSNMTGTKFGVFRDLQLEVMDGDCPTMVGVYGTLNTNSTKDMYGFACNPRVDQVDVNTTFLLPGMQIESAIVDESSSRLFQDNFTSQLQFDYFLPTAVNGKNQAFDEVFFSMINDQKTLNMTDLDDGTHVSTVINATQHMYRVLMAQSLNGNARIPSTNSTRYNGTVIDPTPVRLIQSAISTRILEGCLAAMIICTLLGFYLLRTKEVLPINPCTIAGASTLLAGSDILKDDILPPGSEWRSDKKLVSKGVLGGLVFGLGWWKGPRFGIDIGRADE